MDRKLLYFAKLANEDILPSVLRPVHAAKSRPADTDVTNPGKLSGNFIAHIRSTEVAFNKGIRGHLEANPKCTACSFYFIRIKFYEDVESKRPKWGNKAVKLNVRLQASGKHYNRKHSCNVGYWPSNSACHATGGQHSETSIHWINQNQLAVNRSIVNKVVQIRKGEWDVESGPVPMIAVAADGDGGYNNLLKGRGFYQPRTQSWCTMLNMEEGLEIPVAFATCMRSKLCSFLKAKVGVHLKSWTKTFPTHVAMGNSEKEMCKDCAQQIDGP